MRIPLDQQLSFVAAEFGRFREFGSRRLAAGRTGPKFAKAMAQV
jgi:hypothetical protein